MTTIGKVGSRILFTWLFAGFCFLIFYWFAPDRYWYAFRYATISSDVFISAKPHDCEFLTAPMGRKNCHYTKHVEAVRWQPEPGHVYFQSDKEGPNHSDAFSSIPGERIVDIHTKVYVTWDRENDE
jgi:hypothetical protein